MNPRKLLFSLLLSLLLMLGVSSAMAAEAETPEEMYIFDDLYLTAYGYAVQTSDGVKDLGYILDAEEANTAGTPLFYCVIENRGDKDQNIKLYIRGGAYIMLITVAAMMVNTCYGYWKWYRYNKTHADAV